MWEKTMTYGAGQPPHLQLWHPASPGEHPASEQPCPRGQRCRVTFSSRGLGSVLLLSCHSPQPPHTLQHPGCQKGRGLRSWRTRVEMPASSLINWIILDNSFYLLWVSVSSSEKWRWSSSYRVNVRIQWDIVDKCLAQPLTHGRCFIGSGCIHCFVHPFILGRQNEHGII